MKTIEVLGKPAGFNKCINGNFDFWQRQVSFTGLSTSTYTVDRFRHSTNLVTGTGDVNRDTDIPNEASLYSMKTDVNVAQSSIGSSELYVIDYQIEGYNSLALYNKSISMSFWVKSNKVGTYCIAFRNGGLFNRTYIREYTINSINTWEPKHITIPHEVVGTWNKNNNNGIIISICLAIGSDYFLSPNTWHSSNGLSTSNQVNFFDNATNYINFSQIMVYEGRGLTDGYYMFGGDIASELQACQRYYEKTYSLGTFAGAVTSVGALMYDTNFFNSGTRSISIPYRFSVTKRTTPTLTSYDTSGSLGLATMHTGSYTNNLLNANEFGFRSASGESSSTTLGRQFFHYTADAEL